MSHTTCIDTYTYTITYTLYTYTLYTLYTLYVYTLSFVPATPILLTLKCKRLDN